MNELFGNYEVNLDDPENEKTQKSEKAKLDLFTDVLPNIGSSNYDYYNQLTDDEKKLYQPYTIMKWMSSTQNNSHIDFLRNVNEFVNVDYWSLSKHPGLLHKLFCLSNTLSSGTKGTRHNWVPFLKTNKKKSVINDFLRTFNQNLNDQEIDIIKSNTNVDEFEKIVKSCGIQDAELKKLVKAWKEETK